MMDRRSREEIKGRSSNGGFQFDVFLSFRGTDNRQDFTSHLYRELNRSGAITFIDSEELRKAEKVSCLFQYMESSQIFLPILSENYARSKWCLLEAAKMVEIAERDQQKRRIIIPVFYYVHPSHVKDDGGLYQSAVMEHRNKGRLGEQDMKDCIDALKTIGRISGFSLKRGTDGNEEELTTCICKRVQALLGTLPFGVQPIGIDSRIDEVITMLEAQSNGVCTIGICGMRGIGKTRTAKAIYDKLFNEFDGGGFIKDISEASSRKGLPSIQEKLIYNILGKENVTIDTVERGRNIIKRKLGGKRVLIVLDDVDRLAQLKALLGDQICHKREDLFGGGSKIIVTTRDEGVLLSYGICEHQIYHPQRPKQEKKVMMDRRNREEKKDRSSSRWSSKGGGFQFDVFLSFRGTDTRRGFTNHLYTELNLFGAITFIDSEELPKGEKISRLFQYIESSQIFVPILSKNYASSTWCLLEAAKMVEIAERDQQKRRSIIPVFYYIDPSDVIDDGGLYQSAVMELQNKGRLGEQDMKNCIDALKTIGRISGFSLKRGTDGSEAELSARICKRVQALVGTLSFGMQPIGIDS